MAKTVILPAAIRYQTELAHNVAALAGLGYEPDKTLLDAVTSEISALSAGLAELEAGLGGQRPHGVAGEAAFAADELLPAMLTTRAAADRLEASIADDLWPLPTYQEMLFVL